jgi:hypothetical protein
VTPPCFGLLDYPGIANLGDTIQSLAARRFLPRVDVLIPRERLSELPGGADGPVRTILNGWFMHETDFWPPHPAIEPLLISMHFVQGGRPRLRRWVRSRMERMLSGEGAEFLRRWGPVGARDIFTLEQLERRNIPAYHSGCLTLTLPRDDRVVRTDTIVACDLPPAALAYVRRIATGPVEEVTHLGGEHLDAAGRDAAAGALLDLYAGAAAVVTTRIHAALPCLALGTPVLLVHEARPQRRIADITALFHSCPVDDFVAGRHAFDLADPPANQDGFVALAHDLVERCERFVAKS